MTRFTDDDLWEEHGEWARNDPYPQKQGEGPMFDKDHRKEVVQWVKRQPWYTRMLDRSQASKGQFG